MALKRLVIDGFGQLEMNQVAYRRDERVLRYLTVKMEKYAAEYAEKRRNNKKEA